MTERSIQTGVHAHTGPQTGLPDSAAQSHTPQRDADPQDAVRFGEAMAAKTGANPAPADAAGTRVWSNPFELMGAAPTGAAAHADPREQTSQVLLELMQDSVQRLMVSEDGSSRREVRIALGDAVLPGVSLAVYEDAGAWVADLTCTDPDSYEKLARPASQMARQMAQALSRDALWRVTLEAQEQGEPLTVEAFASWP